MKQILLSIQILIALLFLSYSPIYSQEDGTTEEDTTVEQALEETQSLAQDTGITKIEVKPLEIVFAILAPSTLILISYLLIKKFKL